MVIATADLFTTEPLEMIAKREGFRTTDLATSTITYSHFTGQGSPLEEEEAIKRQFLWRVTPSTICIMDFHYSVTSRDGMTTNYWAEGTAVMRRTL